MRTLLLPLLLLCTSPAAPTDRPGANSEPVAFEFAFPTLAGERLFVLGDLEELGRDDVRRAVPMASKNGVDWQVTVELPLGRDYAYAFYVREDDVLSLVNASNGTQVSETFVDKTRGGPGAPSERRVEVLTSLVDPDLRWRANGKGGRFHTKPMRLVGPGRVAGEARWEATVGAPHGDLAFFLVDEAGGREPATGSRSTALDEVFVQDDEVFSYRPAEHVSPQRRARPLVQSIASDVLDQTRAFRVMLPRGYDEHTDRRYAVLYLYDGQLAWDGAGAWDRDGDRLARLVSGGEVGELIVVAIDYDAGCGRPQDTVPSDDLFNSNGCKIRGRAQDFLTFVVSELKPHVDATWRTRPERETTFLCGYSLGGLLAWVGAYDFSDFFGGVAAQSPSLWAAPNFMQRVRKDLPAVRLDLDFSDIEGVIAPDGWKAANRLIQLGAVVEEDLHLDVGFGQLHSAKEGGKRMRTLLRFLWPATAEQELATRR